MLRSVRFLAFSLGALGLAACAKLNPMVGMGGRPEPRIGEGPAAVTMTENERLEALQDQVAALDVELASLRKALDVMGPLPDQEDFFVPVHAAEITGDIPQTDPETEAAARLARLYAPPPSFIRARSLFYEAELGAFRSRDAAEVGWKRLAGDKRLAGLIARYITEGAETRLIAGPLASEAAVTALCVELSSLAGQCRVAAPVRAY
jgi:hypothetical protein